ncbi:MAG: group-specific protein [Clostridiales bacterium 38-18]|nr:MAG: group-specific protein [Clostridiales bacterium 38-18]
MKRFYIASTLNNKKNVQIVSERLKQEGLIHTYDWTQNKHLTSLDQLREVGMKELEAVKNSDFVVVLLPAGKGSHVELGIAIGNGIKTYLYSENNELNELDKTSTFYHLEGVIQCIGTLDELIALLLKDQK